MATTKKKVAKKTTKKKAATVAPKKKAAPKKRKKKATNPLQQRRDARRAKQFPEGTFNSQLMIPTMRFICLRCGEFQHAVWNETRRKYVEQHGGLPCPRCGDDDPDNLSGNED
jgi:hypothetical protein